MSSKKVTVLVVDDDIRMLRMMKRMLELEGFQVLVANGGEASLKSFEKETPDLVLLDIMMPDIDGYTTCKRIREFSQVPIIMVTAMGDKIVNQIIEQIPIGRLGTPEEIARVVAFLAADESGFITGTNIAINGGMHMG